MERLKSDSGPRTHVPVLEHALRCVVSKSGKKFQIWKISGKFASSDKRILQIGIHSLEFGGKNGGRGKNRGWRIEDGGMNWSILCSLRFLLFRNGWCKQVVNRRERRQRSNRSHCRRF